MRGHTDARPFAGDTSDNWMLSFQRAHATKNALVKSGVDEQRFVRVEGLADRQPVTPGDPLADENRRIEILYQPPADAPATAPAAETASASAAAEDDGPDAEPRPAPKPGATAEDSDG
ncbi:MAG: hypothetical protein AcusKO_20510 [Acuticoccus sp.]